MDELHVRFPRLAAYVASLPRGLESFPECQAKASLVQFGLRKLAPNFPTTALPAKIRQRLEATDLVTDWLPEVHYNAVTLALWDGHELTDDAACDAWYSITHALRTSRLYALLLGFLTRGRLMKGVPIAWGQFHRGTSVAIVEQTANSAVLELIHPPGLFTPLILKAYASVFQSVVERQPSPLAGRVLDPTSTPGRARYVIPVR